MDPIATLKAVIGSADAWEITELMDAYYSWVDRGGFKPTPELIQQAQDHAARVIYE